MATVLGHVAEAAPGRATGGLRARVPESVHWLLLPQALDVWEWESLAWPGYRGLWPWRGW
jgi:hypothetical protein